MVAERGLLGVRGDPFPIFERSGEIRQLLEVADEFHAVLVADFRQFYGVRFQDYLNPDDGEDAQEALDLVGQLCVISGSRYRAELLGGPQFVGWGPETYRIVQGLNMIAAYTAGLGGVKLGESGLLPFPKARGEAVVVVERAATIAEFDVVGFERLLGH